VVDTVVVVVGEVALELAAKAGVAGVEVAGEGGSPALLKDQRCRASTWPLVCGRPERMWGAERGDGLLEGLTLELVAVVAEHALEPPAGPLQLARDPAREPRGVDGGGVVGAAGDTLGPGERGVAVDRGQLPDGVWGARIRFLAWCAGAQLPPAAGVPVRRVVRPLPI
jgi:hypothetical protein